MINKIIKQRKIIKSEMFYVCDEVRDIVAAQKSGIKSIAVTWGYNTQDALTKENPDFIVDTPNELRNIIIS
jgi:phosphoglycolate phosphatase-like HAD superfamily hydrolase